MESKSNRRKPEYYVQVRSLWQGDQGKLFGPFATRPDAQKFADEKETGEGGNLKNVRHTYVLTRTQCIKEAGPDFVQNWLTFDSIDY